MTDDEALIISDWIYQLENSDDLLSDEAVWPALYRINGAFEAVSPLIFAPDYGEELEAARVRVLAEGRDREGIGTLIQLTVDEALVLAHWLRNLRDSGGPLSDEVAWVPLRRIGDAIETKGLDGASLPAARKRLFATMGRSEDGVPFEDVPGYQPACEATRRRLGRR
ncbi:hypothetical protein [Micromonospora kangleipakensis]|nr:hypothetical protein [Micromonospora kangleipakensis]